MKLFTVLWLTGMSGVISLLWMNVPTPENTKLYLPAWGIKLVSLIQPTVLLSIAVLVGVLLGHQVGLSAPLAEAVTHGTSIRLAIQPQLLPGIIGGLVGGILLTLIQLSAKFFLPSDFVAKAETLSHNTPLLTRLLYGGITEELLLRWGVMTLLVWSSWRIFAPGLGEPPTLCFVVAILLSAFLFALGHLPLAWVLKTEVTTSVIAYILVANSVFGLIAGYLYWYAGLEAAIISHIFVHLCMVTATRFAQCEHK